LSVRALSFNQKSQHPISPLDLAGNTRFDGAKLTHPESRHLSMPPGVDVSEHFTPVTFGPLPRHDTRRHNHMEAATAGEWMHANRPILLENQ
jgi:hypothetical protein